MNRLHLTKYCKFYRGIKNQLLWRHTNHVFCPHMDVYISMLCEALCRKSARLHDAFVLFRLTSVIMGNNEGYPRFLKQMKMNTIKTKSEKKVFGHEESVLFNYLIQVWRKERGAYIDTVMADIWVTVIKSYPCQQYRHRLLIGPCHVTINMAGQIGGMVCLNGKHS